MQVFDPNSSWCDHGFPHNKLTCYQFTLAFWGAYWITVVIEYFANFQTLYLPRFQGYIIPSTIYVLPSILGFLCGDLYIVSYISRLFSWGILSGLPETINGLQEVYNCACEVMIFLIVGKHSIGWI